MVIHDEWEKIYIDNIDFNKANELTNQLIQKLFADKSGRQSLVKHRFLGAATPKGAVDFVPNLTEGLPHRYFYKKGAQALENQRCSKKLAKAAEEKGFEVEVYHCGFDPNSLDMVIVRELDLQFLIAPHHMNIFQVARVMKLLICMSLLLRQGRMRNMRRKFVMSPFNIKQK